MPIPREQLRLTPQELDELCGGARELHIATVSPDGWPHVVPLWFVWHENAVWINNLRKSKRSHDMAEGSPVSVCIDDGHEYGELRGAVFYGRFADASDDPRLDEVRARYGAKYWGGIAVPALKSHIWLRLETERTVSWDFRKIPSGADKRLEATREP